jgi:hypothetical protein
LPQAEVVVENAHNTCAHSEPSSLIIGEVLFQIADYLLAQFPA